jgi:hypothetical protein
MVGRYYGRSNSQCQIVSAWVGANCCNFPGGCLVAAPSPAFVATTFSNLLGIASHLDNRPLTFEEVRANIDSGSPVVIWLLSSFSGHLVVIVGYDERTQALAIYDPFFGQQVVPFSTTFTYSGNVMQWAYSHDQFHN